MAFIVHPESQCHIFSWIMPILLSWLRFLNIYLKVALIKQLINSVYLWRFLPTIDFLYTAFTSLIITFIMGQNRFADDLFFKSPYHSIRQYYVKRMDWNRFFRHYISFSYIFLLHLPSCRAYLKKNSGDDRQSSVCKQR